MTSQRPNLLARFGGELFVIVLGVLIALWVDSWREARQERTLQTDLLESLRSEVQSNVRNLEGSIVQQQRILASMRRLMTVQRNTPVSVPPDSLEILFRDAGSFSRARPSFGSYDAMVSTGTSRLLPDPGLAQRLARHRASLGGGLGEEANAERAYEALLSVFRTHGSWMAYLPQEVGDRVGVTLAREPRDISGLFRDPAFHDALFTRILIEDNILSFYEGQAEALRESLQLLEAQSSISR
jgi:hypothetical protein